MTTATLAWAFVAVMALCVGSIVALAHTSDRGRAKALARLVVREAHFTDKGVVIPDSVYKICRELSDD